GFDAPRMAASPAPAAATAPAPQRAALDAQPMAAVPDEIWASLMKKVSRSRPMLRAFLELARPLGCTEDAFCVAVESEIQKKQLEGRDDVSFLESALRELGAPAAKFRCVLRSADAMPPARQPAAPARSAASESETPLAQESAAPKDAPAPDMVERVI